VGVLALGWIRANKPIAATRITPISTISSAISQGRSGLAETPDFLWRKDYLFFSH
jgi:hypothetical protein